MRALACGTALWAMAATQPVGSTGGVWMIETGHPHFFCWNNLAVGDFDGDGDADPVCADSTSPTRVFVFLGGPGDPGAVEWAEPPGGGNQTRYGSAVASAGDVNGDGRDDLIVGASGWGSEGAAFLHYGGPGGPSSLPAWSVFGTVPAGTGLGKSVSGAGDVDGDGYDDVIVADPAQSRALVFRGRPLGPGNTADWVLDDPTSITSVAGVGDLNDDGYDDVALGDAQGAGRAYVYLGSALGPQLTQIIDGTDPVGRLGHALDGAGDVNGDGYDDLIVAAPSYWGWEDRGRVFLYYGSASGVSTTPAWQATGRRPSDYLGWTVSTAGDVNDDGFADVIVGSYTQFESTNPQTCCSLPNCETCVATYPGAAFVFLGGAQGLEACPAWAIEAPVTTSDYRGTYVAGGADVDDDGFSDWIVQFDAGEGHVYFGSGQFPEGDSDGDGSCAFVDCDDTDPGVTATTWYQDRDADGFGDPALTWLACSQPDGFVADGSDCDDTDPLSYPASDVELLLGPERDRLSWSSPPGPPADFDVVRGLVDDWPVGPSSAETCLVSNHGQTSWSDGDEPAAGVLFWYLVRAENACGGTFGGDRESDACL